MAQGICSVDECDRVAEARGLCHKHYQMWRNHGDPLHKRKRSTPESLAATRKRWAEANPEKVRAAKQRWKRANRDKLNAWRRRRYAQRKASDPAAFAAGRRMETPKRYGVSQQEYDALVAFQDGVCALCCDPPSGSRVALDVDHDHGCCDKDARSCGKCVRGLLCWRCNSHLGMGERTPILLAAIEIEYLRHPPMRRLRECLLALDLEV